MILLSFPARFCETGQLIPGPDPLQGGQYGFRRLDRIGKLFFRMGGGHKHSLKLRRSQSNALLEHSGKIPGIGLEIAALGIDKGGDRSRREEGCAETFHVIDLHGSPGLLRSPGQPFSQEGTLFGKLRVDLRVILEIMQLARPAAMATGLPLRVPAW